MNAPANPAPLQSVLTLVDQGTSVTGALITTDAAHTQRDTATFLVDDCRADTWQVKGSQCAIDAL